MYASSDRQTFARKLLLPLFKAVVERTETHSYSQRKVLAAEHGTGARAIKS